MPLTRDKFHLADVLALPIFAVAAAYLWSKPDRTPVELFMLFLAVLGFILVLGFTAIHIRKRMIEIKLKRTPGMGPTAK